jgi:hypothetical protein
MPTEESVAQAQVAELLTKLTEDAKKNAEKFKKEHGTTSGWFGIQTCAG